MANTIRTGILLLVLLTCAAAVGAVLLPTGGEVRSTMQKKETFVFQLSRRTDGLPTPMQKQLSAFPVANVTHIHMNAENMQSFISQYECLAPIYNAIHPQAGACQADVVRYALVHRYGGCYLDDKSLLKPGWEALWPASDAILGLTYERNVVAEPTEEDARIMAHNANIWWPHHLKRRRKRWVCNWGFLTRGSQHPLLAALLQDIVENCRQWGECDASVFLRVLHLTGPRALTRCVFPDASGRPRSDCRIGGTDFEPYGAHYALDASSAYANKRPGNLNYKSLPNTAALLDPSKLRSLPPTCSEISSMLTQIP